MPNFLEKYSYFACYLLSFLLFYSVGYHIKSFPDAVIPSDLVALLFTFANIAFLSFELTLAYFLFIYPYNRTVILFAIATLVMFTIYLLYAYFWGKSNACGCGAGEQYLTTRNYKYLFSLIRNILILLAMTLHLKILPIHVNESYIKQ